MEKNQNKKNEEIPDISVTITLNKIQTAALGLMLHEVLQNTGMKHIDIVHDIKKQIGEHVAAAKKLQVVK